MKINKATSMANKTENALHAMATRLYGDDKLILEMVSFALGEYKRGMFLKDDLEPFSLEEISGHLLQRENFNLRNPDRFLFWKFWDELITKFLEKAITRDTLVQMSSIMLKLLQPNSEVQKILDEIQSKPHRENLPPISFENIKQDSFLPEMEKLIEATLSLLIDEFSSNNTSSSNETNTFLEKINSIVKTLYILLIIREVSCIHRKIDTDGDYTTLWVNTLKIGMLGGLFMQSFNFLTDPKVKDFLSSIKSSEGGHKGWHPINEVKKKAVTEADRLWSEGDTDLHDEMSQRLFIILKEEHPDLANRYPDRFTQRAILKWIRLTARKHKRLRGIKGIKKIK